MKKSLFKNRPWLVMAIGALTVLVVAVAVMTLRSTDHLIPTAVLDAANADKTTLTDSDTGNSIVNSDTPQKVSAQTTSENSDVQTDSEDDESLPPISEKMAAEIRRLEDRSTEGLETKYKADGSAHMDLQGRFQTTTVAVVDKNGKLVIRHGGDFLNNVEPEKK